MRYEDVCSNTNQELTNLFRYIFDQETLEGTILEKRINDVASNKSNHIHYKPKSMSFNYNMDVYTPEQAEYIRKELREFLIYFGYAKANSIEFGFHDLGELDPNENEYLEGFKKINKSTFDNLNKPVKILDTEKFVGLNVEHHVKMRLLGMSI